MFFDGKYLSAPERRKGGGIWTSSQFISRSAAHNGDDVLHGAPLHPLLPLKATASLMPLTFARAFAQVGTKTLSSLDERPGIPRYPVFPRRILTFSETVDCSIGNVRSEGAA